MQGSLTQLYKALRPLINEFKRFIAYPLRQSAKVMAQSYAPRQSAKVKY